MMVHIICCNLIALLLVLELHGPWLMGVCMVLETKTSGFAVKTHPSILLLGVVSFVISKGCRFSPGWKYVLF